MILALVTLNAQRATEEANGQIRYLRPEYQRNQETQSVLELPTGEAKKDSPVRRLASPESRRREPGEGGKLAKHAWPKSLADRVHLIDTLLRTTPGPHTAQSLAKQFTRASEKDVAEILETLEALGRTTELPCEHNS